ncbi:molybdopterin converting factor subunit 1 [Pseudoroseomonas oryzae]|uniref:Molybdopterin synthase sulfur carrier subunit n=1 Tax=Teichococcus oryzae TaxID=1608942 RepID=A0A5B2TCV5_9PROT|nr:molybdopterin converting factor subunit 1 [Pseudoroseomonas oryzae]KAA2212327.1 molybdopterin converting factor subunit 1 [Pseudoroseomonas oryzae]
MRVLYFAWVRHKIGHSQEDISPPAEVKDIASLMRWLATRSPGHAQAFVQPAHVRAAVNHVFCQPDHPVRPGDEVAFFPPVTGG